MRTMRKKGAMEMSMGTIVVVVLAMTMLILGIVFVQKIFKSATGAIDLTDEQLRNEINKLFGDDQELAVYPGTRRVSIKQESVDGVGFGIKNLLQGDRKSTRLNSSHIPLSRMPSSA